MGEYSRLSDADGFSDGFTCIVWSVGATTGVSFGEGRKGKNWKKSRKVRIWCLKASHQVHGDGGPLRSVHYSIHLELDEYVYPDGLSTNKYRQLRDDIDEFYDDLVACLISCDLDRKVVSESVCDFLRMVRAMATRRF